ncbi:C45 family autoproteolytic acyltransferase/hydolase [Polyangium sorediatum]|uniref:C45 family autoproteolytic acyltransferase/hydrolase n=1 Tax=Polyangium sorediatum TaxID=889274 RepID=A0ABT6NIL6_9BACT|nr:C45 family peptidase [Polyangium sorediatum]MDI1428146.1 C45 family autoproteolytic acyltransferase/hydrolase [Polyangium sorediatum]
MTEEGPKTPAPRPRARWKRRLLWAFVLLVVVPGLAHVSILAGTRIEPPALAQTTGEAVEARPGLRVLGPAYARKRGAILEVRLAGTPEEIGHQHSRLLYREMVENEGTLYDQFSHYVPVPPLRWLLVDLSRLEFRHVDQGMQDERRREIAAQARGFSPDPYDGFLSTYHRFVFLHSLYDIALSFEHSPLIGCTSFALGDGAFEDGHTVLARNFDFEAGSIFDTGKAVFLVREQGRIPYASVAWPGLIGAVSGMNAEGLALVVHGARAREPRNVGEPVVHTTRDLLGRAHTTAEAIDLLRDRSPMVSHLIMLTDAKGDVAIVERAPGEPIHVRRGRGKVPLTNHLEGPLVNDPANKRVETTTSTRPRRERLDELLQNLPPAASVEHVMGVLRDKKGLGGVDLPIGHRRSLDALIATHAVVMDTTARVLWVSEGPHLLGRFVRFDVARLLESGYEPKDDEPLVTAPEDPLYRSPAYEAWEKAGKPHHGEL